jgi:hypothetical protein
MTLDNKYKHFRGDFVAPFCVVVNNREINKYLRVVITSYRKT